MGHHGYVHLKPPSTTTACPEAQGDAPEHHPVTHQKHVQMVLGLHIGTWGQIMSEQLGWFVTCDSALHGLVIVVSIDYIYVILF